MALIASLWTYELRYIGTCVAIHVPIYRDSLHVVSSKISRYLGGDTIRVSRGHVSRYIAAAIYRYTPNDDYDDDNDDYNDYTFIEFIHLDIYHTKLV